MTCMWLAHRELARQPVETVVSLRSTNTEITGKSLPRTPLREAGTGTWLVLFKPQIYNRSRCGSHPVSIEGQTVRMGTDVCGVVT